MQDLTDAFVRALARRNTWNPEQTATVVRRLAQQVGGTFKWSQAAGEDWMYLFDGAEDLQALIWTPAPLVIATPEGVATLRALLAANAVEVIEIADWDAPDYSIDPEAVRAAGVPDFWLEEVDVTHTVGFSIMDLRWNIE